MKSYFTCYIEGKRGEWEAHCEDFDLSVTGRTLQETKDRLEAVVRTYLEDAMNEAEPARSRLLERRSPWATRMAWRFKVAATALGAKTSADFEGRFALPCRV